MNIDIHFDLNFIFSFFECPSHVKHFRNADRTHTAHIRNAFRFSHFFFYFIRSMNEIPNFEASKMSTIEGGNIFFTSMLDLSPISTFFIQIFQFRNIVTQSGAEHLWHKHVLPPNPAPFDYYCSIFTSPFLCHLLALAATSKPWNRYVSIPQHEFDSIFCRLLFSKVFILFRIKSSSFGRKFDNFNFNLEQPYAVHCQYHLA